MGDVSGKNLIIACGGTGGHLFPGIAVAEAWKKRGGEVLLLISEKQIDALAAEGYDHLRFERMPSVAMPALFSLKMPGFLIGFLKGLVQCRKLVKSFSADAILGMGGFTSTAPLIAGRLKGIPTFVHEANSIPGRSNKLNARFANAVLVGFEVCAPHFGSGKRTEVVGTPIRPSVANKPSREEGLDYFDLEADRKTLMVMGGSQGARRINELIAAGLPEFEKAEIQVLHLSGPQDYELMRQAYDEHPGAGVVRDFCSQVQFAWAVTDLAICRSGASSLTEQAYYGIPSVLIPYPFSAGDHQTTNAEIFSKPGAAVLWIQNEIDEASFASQIIDLLEDEERLEKMRSTMIDLAIPDASERVCDVIADLI